MRGASVAGIEAQRGRLDVAGFVSRRLPALVGFSILAADGVAAGGYFPRAWRLTTFALLAFTAAALIARRRIMLGWAERWVLASFGALLVWTALSTRWSGYPGTSLLEAERTGVYVAGVATVLLCVERAGLPLLIGGALAGVTAAAGYGLVKYAFFGHSLTTIQGKLLFEPIGYANALGLYAAIGLLLAVGLAFRARGLARLLAAASGVVLIPTLYLTSSRGAWISFAAGLATFLVLARRASPALAVVLAALAAAAFVAVGVVSHQRSIVSLAGENRPRYWRVAWHEYEDNPVLGSGAGTFDEYWLQYRTVPSFARDAHSLYVESLAELGPLGLGLVVAALGLPLVALRLDLDTVGATAAAGYVAYLIHTGLEWDWELPAVTLAGLLCGTALLVSTRDAGARELSTPTRLALLISALAFAVLALFRLETGPSLPFAS